MSATSVGRAPSAARSPVQTEAWTEAFRTAYAATHEVRRLVVGPDGCPAAQVTLVRRRDGVARLELPHLWEPGDLSFRDHDALQELVRAMVDLRVPLLLARLPVHSPTAAAVARAAAGSGYLLRRGAAGWPGLELTGPSDEPERRLNAGRRSDLRRARRRADRLGQVSFEFASPTPAQVPELLDLAVAVEAASWKTEAGTALAVDARRRAFFLDYLQRAADDRAARFAFACLDGRPVATQVAAVNDERLWLLKIGFDEEFRSCSPGQLLMLEVLRRAAADGLAGVELLGTPEPWTRMWTRETRPTVSLHYFPASPRSLPALGQDAWRLLRSRAGR